jgi:hypothetical protein
MVRHRMDRPLAFAAEPREEFGVERLKAHDAVERHAAAPLSYHIR